MNFRMSVVFRGDHVEARSVGDKSYQSSVELWTEITRLCEVHDCYRVLGIADSTRPMPIMDSVAHEKLFQEFRITPAYKIAWVEHNPAAIDNLRFLEMFIQNRYLAEAKLFQDDDEARSWLLAD